MPPPPAGAKDRGCHLGAPGSPGSISLSSGHPGLEGKGVRRFFPRNQGAGECPHLCDCGWGQQKSPRDRSAATEDGRAWWCISSRARARVCICAEACVCARASVRVCFRGRCVRGYVTEALSGANKPQWCNRRLAGPLRGKEGQRKQPAASVPHPPQAGPGQHSPSGPPCPPYAPGAGLGGAMVKAKEAKAGGHRAVPGVDIHSS